MQLQKCYILTNSVAGEDYNAIVMDIEFDFNDLSKTVKIPIINDNLSEPIETFLLVLTPSPNSPSSVTTTPIHNAVVTIKDDDGNLCYYYYCNNYYL